MTHIYANVINWDFVKEEVEFLNYLICKLQTTSSFFERIFGKDTEELKIKFFEEFTKRNVICIPKSLRGKKISIFQKFHLKRPNSILEYPDSFRDYFDFIFVENGTMEVLDSVLSDMFVNNKVLKPWYQLYVLKSGTRKDQFQYLIEGISDPRIEWVEGMSQEGSLLEILIKELKKIGKERGITIQGGRWLADKDLKKLIAWYHSGTSAVPVKGNKS